MDREELKPSTVDQRLATMFKPTAVDVASIANVTRQPPPQQQEIAARPPVEPIVQESFKVLERLEHVKASTPTVYNIDPLPPYSDNILDHHTV